MNSKIQFKKLISLAEMLPHLELIQMLTPNVDAGAYEHYLKEMIPHNYFQIIATQNEEVIGLSGYWIATKIYCGKYLEIDNFIVQEKYRSAGIGHAFINWFEEEAKINSCKLLMLDAYLENFKAHSFYYREGFVARGFHFLKHLP